MILCIYERHWKMENCITNIFYVNYYPQHGSSPHQLHCYVHNTFFHFKTKIHISFGMEIHISHKHYMCVCQQHKYWEKMKASESDIWNFLRKQMESTYCLRFRPWFYPVWARSSKLQIVNIYMIEFILQWKWKMYIWIFYLIFLLEKKN